MENDNKVHSSSDVSEEITAADFVLAQQDKKIHDTKFETKPTTFFKDAMKRFVKNRSSVVAAGILLLVISMAIIVPIADRNDIQTPVAGAKYLPPKWFNDANGFLDGTGMIEAAVINPATGLPDEEEYLSSAIITNGKSIEDSIVKKTSKVSGTSDSVLKYGKGGSYQIMPAELKDASGQFSGEASGIASPKFDFTLADEISFNFHFNADLYKEKSMAENPSLYASILFETVAPGSSETKTYAVTEEKNLLGCESLSGESLSAKLKAEADFASADDTATLNGRFILALKPYDIADCANSAYLTSVEVSGKGEVASFSDPVQEVKKEVANEKKINDNDIDNLDMTVYNLYKTAKRTLADVQVQTGRFRYDYYEAAYGERIMVISGGTLEGYAKKGLIDFDWNDFKLGVENVEVKDTQYKILDEERSPVREIISYTWVKYGFGVTEAVRQEVVARVSMYRYYWELGYLGNCAMPKFFFGTNQNGQDFFKIVFSGLLTSLGLGLLAASINILVGLTWGSISGYFGGWVDMIMERITEILGGMPWIVMMTLIVLLAGSSFWTLLLALCMTGWMGVSGTTRSQFYRYKGREYVLASRTLGASDARLIFKHILPNGVGTIVTGAILMVPSVIFTEANVAYLLPGLLQYENGITSFGITLSDAQGQLTNYPYMIICASIVMILIMIAFNLFGNGLRDAFNPSLKGADE